MQINSNKLLLIDKTSPPCVRLYTSSIRMVFGSRKSLGSVMRNDSVLRLAVYELNAQPARPHANVCYFIVSKAHSALQK